MNEYTSFAPHWIDGQPVIGSGGVSDIQSQDPFDGAGWWRSTSASHEQVESALSSAAAAYDTWSSLNIDARIEVIKAFGEKVSAYKETLAQTISRENGKPIWDATTEVNGLGVKVQASIEAFQDRARDIIREVRGMTSATRFRPHGVMTVLGPFNFPMSMPNSHILPAILAGNTVVFKPSDLTPLCGLMLTKMWHDAGLPPGVLNCVSGGKAVGEMLIKSQLTNGVLFVGSAAGGLAIRRELCEHPNKVVALEMGGNNPFVIWSYDDIEAAVLCIIQSSVVSAGQRCTAARRLIVRENDTNIVNDLISGLNSLSFGHYKDSPEPFYGPLIRPEAAKRVVSQFDKLTEIGGRVLLKPLVSGYNNTLVSPGLIDMTDVANDPDEEIFGPIIKLYRVSSLKEAIGLSNKTAFGLAAGIVTREKTQFETFYRQVNAGIINWNQQLTGATAMAPFGGVGMSGNHRPAGYHSVDYCSYPIASFENASLPILKSLPPGISKLG